MNYEMKSYLRITRSMIEQGYVSNDVLWPTMLREGTEALELYIENRDTLLH